MSGDNVTSGDNQQETAKRTLDPWWIVGFVDGEGCFSVSFHRNPHVRRTRGWQIQPSFHVYQHSKERALLEELRDFFGCGSIRSKGPASCVLTYSVHSMSELLERVIPFFERHRPRVKGSDFATFAEIVRRLRRKEHLHDDGFEAIARLAYSMNGTGKQRARTLEQILAGSSETVRQARSRP